jgi:hypothetical protein
LKRGKKAVTIENPEPFIVEIRMDLRTALTVIADAITKNKSKGIIIGAVLVILAALGVPIHL